jgi:DNA (cytosine-5)-methyltransferase 1
MDTTKAITHVSLCAGYGGIDIGLSRAIPNIRTIAFSEIEGFACANLVAKMETGLLDAAPIWTNLKTFPFAEFRGQVDILSGGYPCQPFSAAGKRLGKEDPRHLWPFIADGIAAMRPNICFFENVEGHISMGLSDVIEDLAGMGYRTTWGIFSAREIGAPHQRKRVFIMANLIDSRLQGRVYRGAHQERKDIDGHAGCGSAGSAGSGSILAHSNGCGGREDREPIESRPTWAEQLPIDQRGSGSREVREGESWPARPGQHQYGWEPPRVVANPISRRGKESGIQSADLSSESSGSDTETMHSSAGEAEPSMGRDLDGSASGMDYAELCLSGDNRTDELRLLGNGVVPATAERAFRTLHARLIA